MADGKIIGVAVDGHPPSEKAFGWAMKHLYNVGDTLVAIHCYGETSYTKTAQGEGLLAMGGAYKNEQAKIDKLLKVYSDLMKEAGVKGHTIKYHNVGKVGESILKVATSEKVCILVAGTRGLTSVKRAFLGSVSDFLAQNATIPVAVYRDAETT